MDFNALGFTPALFEIARAEGLIPGRVAAQSHGLCRVLTPDGERRARLSGRLRHEAPLLPVAGDFVLLDDSGVIHRVIERRSVFVRRSKGGQQAVAANIDTVFVCMGLDRDFNLRRLERYLSVAWDSGALPVVVLTKADLCADAAAKLTEAQDAAPGVEVVVSPDELERLKGYIAGRTVAFIGSSGVGKSTLVNRLAGEELLATGATRRDGRGRHTTTSRELLPLLGGAVIDTPGMRELGIERADLSRGFADIDALAKGCRFADCGHESEPGCAVRAAVESGDLSEERLDNWRKLRREAAYAAMDSRQIEAAKIEYMLGPGGMKLMRQIVKEKEKRR
jgi:ribosome biogenesis GTPase